jgi:hypothetical protein
MVQAKKTKCKREKVQLPREGGNPVSRQVVCGTEPRQPVCRGTRNPREGRPLPSHASSDEAYLEEAKAVPPT